jgi:hypothetical protein
MNQRPRAVTWHSRRAIRGRRHELLRKDAVLAAAGSEFRRLVEAAASASSWIAKGNYGGVRDLLCPRATTVVWLNYGFVTVFFRALRRTLHRTASGETLWHGNRESLLRSFTIPICRRSNFADPLMQNGI